MSARAAALVIAVSLALAGCMALGPQTPTQVGAAQSGKAVHLYKGDTLVVALHDDPQANTRWRVEPMQGAVLQQVGMADLLPGEVAEGTVGAPNDTVYRFRANAAGSATLALVQRGVDASAAGGTAPSVRFDVTVTDSPGAIVRAWTK